MSLAAEVRQTVSLSAVLGHNVSQAERRQANSLSYLRWTSSDPASFDCQVGVTSSRDARSIARWQYPGFSVRMRSNLGLDPRLPLFLSSPDPFVKVSKKSLSLFLIRETRCLSSLVVWPKNERADSCKFRSLPLPHPVEK